MADLRTMHAPIDRVAARVMRPGIHYEKKLPEAAKHWREAPKTKPFVANNPTAVDLTGRKFGLFTVIGYLGRVGGNNSGGRKAAMWLVRCACGDFEQRTAKAVKNSANAEDRCAVCRDVEFRRSGVNDPVEWFRVKQDKRR